MRIVLRLFVIFLASVATAAILIWWQDWPRSQVIPGVVTSGLLSVVLYLMDQAR